MRRHCLTVAGVWDAYLLAVQRGDVSSCGNTDTTHGAPQLAFLVDSWHRCWFSQNVILCIIVVGRPSRWCLYSLKHGAWH